MRRPALQDLFPRSADIPAEHRLAAPIHRAHPPAGESVPDALRAFSIRSMVATRQAERSKALLDAIVEGRTSKSVHTGFIL